MKCFQTKYKLLCLYKGDADLTFTFATNVFLSLAKVYFQSLLIIERHRLATDQFNYPGLVSTNCEKRVHQSMAEIG